MTERDYGFDHGMWYSGSGFESRQIHRPTATTDLPSGIPSVQHGATYLTGK